MSLLIVCKKAKRREEQICLSVNPQTLRVFFFAYVCVSQFTVDVFALRREIKTLSTL